MYKQRHIVSVFYASFRTHCICHGNYLPDKESWARFETKKIRRIGPAFTKEVRRHISVRTL